MRRHYLDNIRWMTVVAVVVYHVIFIYNVVMPPYKRIGAFAETQTQDAVLYVLYPWFMILLFIVAGISSRCYLETHSICDFVHTRTRKLLVPSTIGLLLFGWLQGWLNMTLAGGFDGIPDTMPKVAVFSIMVASGTGVLWFIQMLWLFSMLLALVRKFEKGGLYELCGKANVFVLLLLGVPLYFSGFVLNTPVVTVYRFGIYAFAFFLGYFVFAHENIIDRLGKIDIPLGIAALMSGALYLYLHYGDEYAIMPTVNSVSAVVYAWLASLAILALMKRRYNRESAFTSFMTKRSFGLYVFHYFPLTFAAWMLELYAKVSAVPTYAIAALSAFFGAFVLYETVVRIPFVRWCLLGIKKSAKKISGEKINTEDNNLITK